MSCNKKRIRLRTKSYSDLFRNLKNGMCRISFKNNKQIFCTLDASVMPSEGCSKYKKIKLDTSSDKLSVWSFNKNINTDLDPSPGWFIIEVDQIDDYEFIGEIKLTE